MAIDAARRTVASQLNAAGFDQPALDARHLLELATGHSITELVTHGGRGLSECEAAQLDAILQRRLNHEPISRIRGTRDFYGRTVSISRDVLDPRPETEAIVEFVLGTVRTSRDPGAPVRILDVGTGSGCILVSLLAELPRATGVGTDVSLPALALAQENAERHGVLSRARFEQRRSLEGVTGTFDFLVSNPPYIPSPDLSGLEPEVLQFDPAVALDGGPDGLAIYRDLAAGLAEVVPNGWAVFEFGAGQAQAVVDIFRARHREAIKDVHLIKDLAGHTRCVALRTHF
jgi:release factor glutamine methyltransferase